MRKNVTIVSCLWLACKCICRTVGNESGKAKRGLKDYVLSNRKLLKVSKQETDLAVLCFRKLIW